ncbi:MAG: hypothetical protein P8046_06245 [Anaerolineales bacterium]
MNRKFLLILILLVFTAACSSNNANVANEPQTNAINATAENSPTPIPELDLPEGPDCYGEDPHPIGESIADLFSDITDYTQVMTWFCNGFEFEDVVTALETQLASGTPASDLLAMFQSGKDWDTIWVELGIVKN